MVLFFALWSACPEDGVVSLFFKPPPAWDQTKDLAHVYSLNHLSYPLVPFSFIILPGCLEQYRDTKSSSCCRCIIYFATGGWCQWRRISPIRHQWCPCHSNSNKGKHYNGFSFHSQHPNHTPETIHLSIIICRLGSTTLSMQLPKKNLKWAQPSPSPLTDTAGYVG